MIKKLSILDSDFIGVYSRVWDDIALVPKTVPDGLENEFESILGVRTIRTIIDNSYLIGCMSVMNSNGIIIAGSDPRLGSGETYGDRNVLYLKDKINAIGNDVLTNDRGAIIHKSFTESSRKKIEDSLGVEVLKDTIANVKTVGSVAVVTNKGMLVTPEVSDEELKKISEFFKVNAKPGTANFGSVFVGSSILANTKGIFVGRETTPIEIGRIDDTLS
ncbi:MAG: translation initiation factor IF-6 [Thermoplasmataceae archaeon]